MKRIAVLMAMLVAAAVFADTLVLQPDAAVGKDAMLASNGPSTNYGTYTWLTVNFGSSVEVRGILEFDITPVMGSTINSATLELWIEYGNSTNYNFGIYRVTESWVETTVTWSNQPGHYATAYDIQLVSGAAGSKITFDAKTLIADWAAGTYPNYGMIFKRVDLNNPTAWPYPRSSDNAGADYRPKLTVDYTPSSAIAPTSLGRVKALYR